MMTEEEAKTKWCPHAFTFGSLHGPDKTNYGPQNRGYSMNGPLGACQCIASQCMAWRWAKEQPIPNGPKLVPTVGYCGLAGTP